MGNPTFGWLAPDNELYLTQVSYGHINLLVNAADKYFSKELCAEIDYLETIYKECQELSEQGEHPEWHRYEMAEDSIRHTLLKALIRLGFIRLGTDKLARTLYYHHLGGLELNDTQLEIIKDLAKRNGIDYISREYGRI